MFQLGETVLYDMWGVCIIESIESQKTPEGLQDYLVLRPVYHSSAKLYLPRQEEQLQKALRYALTPDEIRELLQDLGKNPMIWVADHRERRKEFQDILASGDRKRLLGMIRLLYLQRKALREQGKQLRMADEQALRDGEKLLNGEFAYVLQMSPQEVPAYIQAFIETVS